MKCSFCQNENAIINIHEYSIKGTRKINLCFECALKKGLNIKTEEIDKIFENLIKNIFKLTDAYKYSASKGGAKSLSLICPVCKTKIDDINTEMRVGCPICYTVFENFIDLMIYKMNNSLSYKGNLPNDLKLMINNRAKLSGLKKELKRNINEENFTNAALVRDEIKELKKEIQNVLKKRKDM